jgi:crotonobetainyl-CoA:carnitine CoA-transferase CaiB-like acyl-CoA transferase
LTPPLEGLVVVALEQAVAAPFATRQLADWGARIIKIERPGTGDFARHYDRAVLGQSAYFVWLNRGKESITLDIKRPEAVQVVRQLVSKADVFIQNLAPGSAERLGLGAEQLCAEHPRLVACDLSGYGNDGPFRDRKAYDLLVQAEAGLLSLTGVEEHPSRVGISVADISAGMYALTGILMSLYERERTGRGHAFAVSLIDTLGEWMGFPAYFTQYGGTQPRRTGASHATIAPYGAFTTGDGATIMIGIQNEREWAALCRDVLRRPELIDDVRFAGNAARVQNRPALDGCVGDALRALTFDEAVARLDAADIAHARLNDVAGFLTHSQLAARDRWREHQTPNGPVRGLMPPVSFADREAAMGPIPALGEHTDAVLHWLGYDAAAISALRDTGAI